MDDNTFKLAIAVVSMIQIVALAYLGIRQQQTATRVDGVLTQLTVSSTAAAVDAAGARGELIGRDAPVAAAITAPIPLPVTIVAAETTLPVQEQGKP